jgi:hypothetical protein
MSDRASIYVWWLHHAGAIIYCDRYLRPLIAREDLGTGLPARPIRVFGPGLDVTWLPTGEVVNQESEPQPARSGNASSG